jgi:hypothetical protein
LRPHYTIWSMVSTTCSTSLLTRVGLYTA